MYQDHLIPCLNRTMLNLIIELGLLFKAIYITSKFFCVCLLFNALAVIKQLKLRFSWFLR